MDRKPKILVAGRQASGKGTQAEILAEKLKLPIFSAGNLLRQRNQEGDELGNQLAEIMRQGKLVSDDVVNEIMLEKIKQDGKEGYILDGYPRNPYQFNFFNQREKLSHVLEVYISDKETYRRIEGRRTCPKCQAVYHIEYKPPQIEGVCDKCGGKLVVRDDEKPEAIKERLGVYHSLTEPMLEEYKKQGVYHRINGEQPIVKVAEDMMAIL